MPYFHETVLFLHECAIDPYPELKVAGLARLERLALDPALPDAFHFYCTPLVRAVMRQLHPRHARVRCATARFFHSKKTFQELHSSACCLRCLDDEPIHTASYPGASSVW